MRYSLTFLVFVTTMICYGQEFSSTITNDSCLIAYYPFTGNANDSSGNNLHGTVVGAKLTSDQFGNQNQAYEFDGNDYIEIDDNPKLTLGSDDFTIAACVKINSFGADGGYYLMGHSNGPGSTKKWIFWLGTNRIQFIIGPSPGWISLGTYSPSLNTWAQVAIRRKNDTLSAFFNDSLIGTVPISANIPDPSNKFFIGTAEFDRPNRPIRGAIDEIKIYRCALTDQEIKALCDSSFRTKSFKNPVFNFQVSPNPSSGIVELSITPKNSGIIDISVGDILGQRLFQSKKQIYANNENKILIGLQKLSAGIYVMHLNYHGRTVSRKLIIKK